MNSTKLYSPKDIFEIIRSFPNFEGFVGVQCTNCGARGNILPFPEGFFCPICNFYNRKVDISKIEMRKNWEFGIENRGYLEVPPHKSIDFGADLRTSRYIEQHFHQIPDGRWLE